MGGVSKMTPKENYIAQEVLRITQAVGSGELEQREAIEQLESIAADCDFAGATELWQVSKQAYRVFASMYPVSAGMAESSDSPASETAVEAKQARMHFVVTLLNIVMILDSRPERRQGASDLRATYASSIPSNPTPFVDRRGFWRHTH